MFYKILKCVKNYVFEQHIPKYILLVEPSIFRLAWAKNLASSRFTVHAYFYKSKIIYIYRYGLFCCVWRRKYLLMYVSSCFIYCLITWILHLWKTLTYWLNLFFSLLYLAFCYITILSMVDCCPNIEWKWMNGMQIVFRD